jgi:hypothetical protein
MSWKERMKMTDKSVARPVELTPGHWQPSFDAGRCANCGQSALAASPLFCSEVCSQTAKLVRYARRKVLDGTVDRPDIAEAIQIRLALILGGGYPAKARTIPTLVRRAVFDRDSFTCQLFGAPATEIDHIGSSSNDLSNLRALCGACNLGLAQAHLVPAGPDESRVADAIWRRIETARPVRLCDDEVNWDILWRQLKSQAVTAFTASGK